MRSNIDEVTIVVALIIFTLACLVGLWISTW